MEDAGFRATDVAYFAVFSVDIDWDFASAHNILIYVEIFKCVVYCAFWGIQL